MKNNRTAATLALFFLASALAFAGGPKRKVLIDGASAPPPYADSEVLVKFKEIVSRLDVTDFAANQGLVVKKRFDLLSSMKGQQIVLLKSKVKIDSQVLAKKLAADPRVVYAHPKYRREMAATPNDTQFSSLCGMNNTGQTGGTNDADIDAPEGWDISTGSSNVIVAVIDTGLDYNHADLAANCWKNPGEIAGNGIDDDDNGYVDDIYGIDPAGVDGSGSSGDSDPMDGYGHGTHCAGTIGARGNNSLGVAGVNWDVKIMGLKFFDDSGANGYDAFSIECIQYAVYQRTHGQNVVAINASWGGYLDTTVEPIDALRDSIEIATNVGIAFCAAAGNGDGDGDTAGDDNDSEIHHYPSDYTLPGIISVAATDHNDDLGSFSNYGATSVDLGAPGVSILSSVPRAYLPHEGDVFFDDMEHGAGNWVTSGTNNSWAITDEYEIYWGGDYPSCPSPTHFWSDRPGVGGSYTFYLSNTNSFLTYNADIDLSSYAGQDVYLGVTMGRHIGRNDHVYVQISNNSGSSWYTIQDWSYTSGSIYFWASFSWAIPEAYKTAHFRMRFNLVSNNSDNGIGVVLDDIGIVTSMSSPYESWNGTSMATPHGAGAVAWLASSFPGETVAQRKERILYGGDPKASLSGRTVTGRRLNLYGAYAYTPASGPSYTVTSPNGGEVWTAGTSQNLTWTSTGTPGNVDIYYSIDSGANWTSIVTNTANDGTHTWTVPAVTSDDCLIRVWGVTDHDPSDTSDTVFSIVPAGGETVTTPSTPTGATSGMVGTAYTYTTGGSTSSMSHSIQYRFDWGDGTYSVWLPVGTTSASHSWLAAGTYNVRAMARCSTHYVQSDWSTALAVDLGDTPTFAAVSRFGAAPGEPLPTVEWHTASEMGVAGFRLFRQDERTREFLPVSASFLPALADSPQGGIYRLADPGAFPGEPQTYRLDEVKAQGQARSYGPFTIDFGARAPEAVDSGLRLGKEDETGIEGYRRFRRERSSWELERIESRSRAAQAGEAQAVPAGGLARVTVKGKGIFYVQAVQVARALGIDETSARLAIAGYGLKLTGMGRETAWLADAGGAGLYFYNPGVETVFSDRNVYFLEPGSGRRILGMSLPGAVAVDGQSFADALHFEENRYPLLISALDPAGDIWFWDWVSGGESKEFAVSVPAPAAGQATLAMSLQGATDTPAEEDHHAVVSVNGRQVGEARWNGTEAKRLEASFDASLLQDGGNTVTVAGLLDTEAPYSVFYVESIDLSCPRYYRALENRLVCRGDGNRVITVGGLTETKVLVLDVSRPERPLQVDAGAVDVLGRVSFVPADPGKEYALSGLNSALRPLAVTAARPAKIPDESQTFAHAVIAPREFKKAAGELAAHRSRQGLKSVLVLLEDIYDAYSHGVPDPFAIRSFLAQLAGNGLKYAVLAGKGTYDYNDYSGYGDNLVPALLGKTPEGLCAADRIFGDLKGKNGVPEVAVGRLPAATGPELQAMIDKIKAYEAGQGTWLERGLWIADNADSGGDFAAGSDQLAALATGTQAEKAYLAGSAADVRARIAAAWNAGLGLVSYCGHAGINQLATENLLDVPGALALANGEQLPLAVMLTCAAGRFELPGFMSLGEALLANAGGGMAGGMLPSGAAYHSDSMRLAEQWYKAVYQARAARAGDAWLAALKNYVQLGGKVSLLNVYNWLGDPGMLLK